MKNITEMTERVQALIAKAESSPFPHEADAFMAKAHALIREHAIDEARLRGVDPSTIGHETVDFSGSYTAERALLWAAVAHANRCQVLTLTNHGSRKPTAVTLVGRPHDRDMVQLLAASLEVQALRRMSELDPDRTWASPVVQRRSFLRGFASEVADRLRRSDAADARATVDPSARAARQALVLAADSVNEYVADNFDVTAGRRSRGQFDGTAWSHGRRAGARADVGGQRIAGDGRRGLPSGSS